METERCSFHKQFSELPGLQCARQLDYMVCWDENGSAYFELIQTDSAGTCTQRLAVQGLAPGQPRALLTCLYENAVPMPHWQDVLQDLLALLRSQTPDRPGPGPRLAAERP